MSKYAVDPRSKLYFLDPKKMNFRRDSQFNQGEVFKCVTVFKLQAGCVYGMAHCKVKSSDDIINNVLKTGGRSLCFGLCFHSIGNQSCTRLQNSF